MSIFRKIIKKNKNYIKKTENIFVSSDPFSRLLKINILKGNYKNLIANI